MTISLNITKEEAKELVKGLRKLENYYISLSNQHLDKGNYDKSKEYDKKAENNYILLERILVLSK